MSQFFGNLVLVGVIVIIASRVAVALDREQRLSNTAKWAILIGLVLAASFFLSVLRRFGP